MLFNYVDLSTKIIEQANANLENAVVFYLANVPFENCNTEHGLLFVRRSFVSFLKTIATNYEERCRVLLSEPMIVETAQQNSSKTPEEIMYEIGKLLAEWGEHTDALSMFNKVLLQSNIREDITIMAKDAKAVVLQNTGLYDEARKILMELKDEIEHGHIALDTTSLRYFVYKHYATILRRIEYQNIPKKSKQILELLNCSAAAFDSYHISYSKGYIYYLLNDNSNAIKEYEACIRKLESLDTLDSYYMIHIKYLLSLMQIAIDKNTRHGRICLSEKMSLHLNKYKKALVKYPNYKTSINELLVTIIESLANGRLQDLDSFCNEIGTLVRSPESLHCLQKDLMCIFEYFENPIFKEKVENKLREIASRIRKISKTVGGNSYVDVISKPGMCICFDIREYSKFTKSDSARACGCVQELGAFIQEYLGLFIDDISYSGDGFIVLKNTGTNEDAEVFINIIENIYRLSSAFEGIYQDVKLKLGVGIAFGNVLRMNPTDDNDESYFFGSAVNTSSRMCNLAKPTGIVISTEELDKKVVGPLINSFNFRQLQLLSKYDEQLDCLVSPRVIDFSGYRYFRVSDCDLEKRIFVDYGDSCTRYCQYCLADLEDNGPLPFDNDTFIKELELLCHERLLDGYMFSIGHHNEPLDSRNNEKTLRVLKSILERTSAVIQIATKASLLEISSFIDMVEPDDRKRVFIFISLTSVKYSQRLENREVGCEKLLETLLVEKKANLIGYVKPFLPGITDSDEELIDLLRVFPTVVVGYAYLSDRTMKRLWSFCNSTDLLHPSRDYYNVYMQKYRETNISRLPLLYPCQGTENTENLSAYDCSGPLEKFIEKLRELYPQMHVFRSSPCAIAQLTKSSCYTSVGSPLREMSAILCKGDDGCPNSHCLYNLLQSESAVEIIISWLKHFYSDIPDKSHSLDHFLRVLHIARQILEIIPEDEKKSFDINDREILELSCLVHDLGDRKLSNSILMRYEVDRRAEKANEILEKVGIDADKINRVTKIITAASFGDHVLGVEQTGFSDNDKLICEILADADKIDAIGAIGIARCFGFKKNRGLFNVFEEPRNRKKLQERPGYASAFIHFYEKLIQLFDLLNRPESKLIAKSRHEYLLGFVFQFLDEYEEPFAADSTEKLSLEKLRGLATDTSWWDV